MRAVLIAFAVFVLSLLSTAVALASTSPGDALQQSCQKTPCSDSWAQTNCTKCKRAYVVSPPNSDNRITYPYTGGTYTTSTHSAESGEMVEFSREFVTKVQEELDALINQMPESLERDRAAAQIFADNGLLFDQAEILSLVVANSGLNVNPEDVAIIQGNYEKIGLGDVAVEYGDWLNQQNPAYEINILGRGSWYLDTHAALRKEIFTNNAAIYSALNDSAKAGAALAVVRELEQQLEESLMPNIILIAAQ